MMNLNKDVIIYSLYINCEELIKNISVSKQKLVKTILLKVSTCTAIVSKMSRRKVFLG